MPDFKLRMKYYLAEVVTGSSLTDRNLRVLVGSRLTF